MAAPILVVRHPEFKPRFYDVVLAWAQLNAPDCVRHFDVRDLPVTDDQWWSVRLFVPWLQDPVQDWSPDTYRHVEDLASECGRRGIPVVNRALHLTNAGKLAGARLMAGVGLRVPKMQAITDRAAFRRDFLGFAFPFFVREDWGHGKAMERADTPEQARALPLEQFERPVVTEIVDVRSPADGLVRKYRYFACRAHGVTEHMQASEDWITRAPSRVGNDRTQAEELAYIARQDPHHERFQSARRAMNLDMVAFDYGYTPEGEPVVWEANPYPHVMFSRNRYRYRNRAVHRAVGAMLAMYLEMAKLPVPGPVAAALDYSVNPSFAAPEATD